MKLLSKKVDAEDFVILNLGKNILLDGTKTLVMAGPCAAESRDQILESAEFLSKLGVKIFEQDSLNLEQIHTLFRVRDQRG
jgi:3-deoxy-7-phosphoheptulonate synthase